MEDFKYYDIRELDMEGRRQDSIKNKTIN